MSGLLQRAVELIGHRPALSNGEEIVFDQESGISREDQQEILAEIDRVARENRITVTPDTFRLHAVKRGSLFPLVVNILSVVLLVGGGLGLYLLFQQGESDLRQAAAPLTTAEGRLLQELKKEAEARLLEKNREIGLIQERLLEIDRERQNLAATMDARVSAREEELRRSLAAELAAEKERLRGQGLAEADIARRLQQMEALKSEQQQRELAAFRAQAEEERRRTEDSLVALQAEYRQNLSRADEERTRVLEESRRREEELQSRLAAREQALEQETLAARQELGRLAAQREQEDLAAGQLLGFYAQVKANLEGARFEQALAGLEAIRQFLDDPRIATLPGFLRRRDIELFVVDSLAGLIRGEMGKEVADTSSLIAAAALMGELKSTILRADEQVRLGRAEEAERLYGEALGLLPEVNRAHEFFLARSREIESARAARLKEQLSLVENAFASGDHAAVLDHSTRALQYLPEDPAVIDRLIARVRESGYRLGSLAERRDQSGEAAAAMARAERLQAQGRQEAAIAEYLDLIRRYPDSDRVAAAAGGIQRAVNAETARLRRSLEEKDGEIQARQAELEKERAASAALPADFERRIAELQRDLDGRVALIGTLQQEKLSLQEQVEALRREVAEMERGGYRSPADAGSAATAGPTAGPAVGPATNPANGSAATSGSTAASGPQAGQEELTRKLERLQALEERYNRLTGRYQEYIAGEDALLETRGAEALIEGKLHLNAFLAAAEEMFPGLWDRLKRYDEAFQSAGRAGAMREISDLLYDLSFLTRPEERARYLETEARRHAGDPLMGRFLEDLRDLQPDGI